jgi:CRP/FNR family transcriptional regulator, anaerobic regulatory protein
MLSEKLYAVLSSIKPISERFRKALDKEITSMDLPKNYFLLEAPRVADHAFFLETGFALSYSFINGKKQVENFWQEGEIILPAQSFFERTPSTQFIVLVQEGEVLHISHSSVMKLFAKFPVAHHIARTVMNIYQDKCRERITDIQHYSAFDRYMKLIQEFPAIEQVVSQEEIASYLSITPQSLSRIRRKRHSGLP